MINSDLIIGNKYIGAKHKPYIIAEMSGNHKMSLDRALKIVDVAADTGVDAIKLQTYTADTMTLDLSEDMFQINDPESLWYGKSMYQLYEEAHTPWDWHPIIMDRAKKKGLDCFSSPFDETAVDFLEKLNVPAYKIASFECVDIPLIEYVASKGKPIIISTGMANKDEIQDAVNACRIKGLNNLILLKCTSTYPADPKDSDLLTIPDLKDTFKCEVGLSDHTLGIGVAVSAIALGACVIEKHFTLSREEGGVDAAFSLEPKEMKQLVEEVDRSYRALGAVNYGVSSGREEKSLHARRSIYFVKNLKAGDTIKFDDLARIRPGFGLSPKYFQQLIGKKVVVDVFRGDPVQLDHFDEPL